MTSNVLTDKELSYWLAFVQVPCKGLGSKRIMILYDRLGSLEEAWTASRQQLIELQAVPNDVIDNFLTCRQKIEPEALLDACRKKDILVYPVADSRYPRNLKEIADPPALLFVKGKLGDLKKPIAIVGTRRPTAYGQRLAKEMAYGLAQNGATVVSGMAIGIDSLAHRGAIDGSGQTIAVLGCGVDYCYPSSNRPLYKMLSEQGYGAVISEYPPGTKPDTWRFPERNRIISGCSDATVVIEAGLTSGSLITARMAFDQIRPVFAVPGRVDNPMSEGTHELIIQTKAKLVRNYQEVLEDLKVPKEDIVREEIPDTALSEREKELYEMLTNEPVHFDSLCERFGSTVGELSALLTMLELAGKIECHYGNWYSRR